MARIRTIKPEFFRHEGLYEAELKTGLPLRLSFAGLWTSCDREGRFKWKPRALKLDVLPYDEIDFVRVLDALVTHGFIVKYENNGEEFGCVPSWNLHQVINNRESASNLPSFDESVEISTGLTHGSRVDDASLTPLVQVKVERNGMERKGNGNAVAIHCPPEVLQQTWDDWMIVRKQKNAKSLTTTAWTKFKNQVEIAGWTLEQAISHCCLKNWVAFDADWIKQKYNPADVVRQTVPSKPERDPELVRLEEERKLAVKPNPEMMAKLKQFTNGIKI